MPNFDLIDEPWLDFSTLEGHTIRCSLKETFEQAHKLCHVAESSPLLAFGVYRFLVAVAHWVRPIADEAQWHSLWRRSAFPADLIGSLLQRAEAKFNMLGNPPRFYQHPASTTSKSISIGQLALELPSGTNINHFWHGYDHDHALCLPCTAKCLLTLAPFAPQGGQGHRPSINGNPPLLYHIPIGQTLFQTILLNLPVAQYDDLWPCLTPSDLPAWERHLKTQPRDPLQPVGLLEGLTWQPRRPWLCDPEQGVCSLCGAHALVVRAMVWQTHGDSRFTTVAGKSKERPWSDPHIALERPDGPGLRPKDADPAWELARIRTVLPAPPQEPPVPAPILRQLARLCSSGALDGVEPLTILQISFRAKQAIPESSEAKAYRLPPTLLGNPDGCLVVRAELERLSKAVNAALRCFSKAQHADPPSLKNPKKLRLRLSRHIYRTTAMRVTEALPRLPANPTTEHPVLQELRAALARDTTTLVATLPLGRPTDSLWHRPQLQTAIENAVNRSFK